MIWEQGCAVIVNLTCLMEDSVSLCYQYWPDADRQFYHIYEASLTDVTIADVSIHEFFVVCVYC